MPDQMVAAAGAVLPIGWSLCPALAGQLRHGLQARCVKSWFVGVSVAEECVHVDLYTLMLVLYVRVYVSEDVRACKCK